MLTPPRCMFVGSDDAMAPTQTRDASSNFQGQNGLLRAHLLVVWGEKSRFYSSFDTPEANGCTFAPGFPLGDQTSRGHRPRYGKTPPSGQRAPVSPADLPAQRMQAQIPSAVSQPARLSGSGMPARGPPLARGAAEGQTSAGRRRQNQTRPGRESAPPASEVRISDR